jgi:integrase
VASITKLPSGHWRALIRRRGVTKSNTFRTKAQAQQWATAMEDAIAQGSGVGVIRPPKSMTVGDVIEAYLENVTTGRTATASLKATARALGSTPITDLGPLHLQSFIARRRKQGVSGATLAGDLSHFGASLRWARHVRRIDVNEGLAREARASLTANRISTRSRERTRLPTDSELTVILAHLTARPHAKIPVATIVRFALVSGMRLGEICSVLIEDMNESSRSIVVRQRKHPTAKLSNDQVVPLVGAAFDLAVAAKGERTAGRLYPFDSRSVSSAFTRAISALGINDLRFHDLRHRALTDAFKLGLDIPHVALISGHKSWSNLRRYTQLSPADVHARLAVLQKASGD